MARHIQDDRIAQYYSCAKETEIRGDRLNKNWKSSAMSVVSQVHRIRLQPHRFLDPTSTTTTNWSNQAYLIKVLFLTLCI